MTWLELAEEIMNEFTSEEKNEDVAPFVPVEDEIYPIHCLCDIPDNLTDVLDRSRKALYLEYEE